MWSGDDELPQFVEVRRGDGLRESELAREDRGYPDFVGLDVDVRGDDRARSVVDTLAL